MKGHGPQRLPGYHDGKSAKSAKMRNEAMKSNLKRNLHSDMRMMIDYIKLHYSNTAAQNKFANCCYFLRNKDFTKSARPGLKLRYE